MNKKIKTATIITEVMKQEDMKKRFDIVQTGLKQLLTDNKLEIKALIKEEGPVIVFKDIKVYV
jgi:hypothetical protein